ncbi:MAG TPA: hypothetical protein VJA94_12545 [Candidatus Angelobacter sp.]
MQSTFLRPLLLLLLITGTIISAAQTQTAQSETNNPPAAKPGDVDSVEHILAAVYDVISGPPGARDWNRFRSLFYPGARLIPTRRDDSGKIIARVLTPEEYIERSKPFLEKEGFFEAARANRVEMWDRIAHVWSTYESRHTKDGQPFARGINSFQLLYDGSRWWVITIYWEGEEPAHPLPEKYLSK